MSHDVLLVGIDLGTTICKAMVLDERLRILGAASCPLSLVYRSGTEVEQDAESWWGASKQALRDALVASGASPSRVRALSVSSQGISFVPVDDAGNPLRPAFSWLDTRASEERNELMSGLGEKELFELTGKRCAETYLLPKLLWLRRNEPQTWKRCRRILMPLDFLMARLTGEYVTDHTMASGTMMYDITRREWCPAILGRLTIDADLLPRIVAAGTPVGGLRPQAALELGLPAGTVVSMGGQDQKVAALGAGLREGQCTISLGTAMAITQRCATPVVDPMMRIPCFSDLATGNWVLEGSSICCSILEWAKQTIFPGRSDEELSRLADEERGRSDGPSMIPFFSGAPAPFSNPSARGAFVGLNLSTTAGQLVRSIYEGIAYLIRANLEVMEDISRPVEGLRIFGGGSRSATWCEIISDVVRRPVRALANSECASVGAAILAGKGIGLFTGPDATAEAIGVGSSYEPDPRRADGYDARYAEFERLVGGRGSERRRVP